MTTIVLTFPFSVLDDFCLFFFIFLPEVAALEFCEKFLSSGYVNIYFYRAISVILGDRWKKMKNEERRMYTLEAKALAEEQKRLNPDCWKRKRTNSVCFNK